MGTDQGDSTEEQVPRGTSNSRAELARLLRVAQHIGHLGPGEVDDHIDHAMVQAEVGSPQSGERWFDLGSGAGLPGLIFALDWEVEMFLVDRSGARCDFLRNSVEELDLADRVLVIEGDATEVARDPRYRGSADGVCARAFGSPAALAECAAPLLCTGGRLVVSEPPGRTNRWPSAGLALVGMGPATLNLGPPAMSLIHRVEVCPETFPRRWARLKKRPLF